ncbi:hypothetical protein GCM10023223_39250 [Stackebrandtia albiflava]
MLAVAGCGGAGEGATGAEPAPVSGLPAALTVSRTGGIAGLAEHLTVSSDGTWTYEVARRAPETGEFTDGEVEQLAALAWSTGFTVTSEPSGDGCADAFVWSVTRGAATGHPEATVTGDDCGGAPNADFAQLITLVTEATPL